MGDFKLHRAEDSITEEANRAGTFKLKVIDDDFEIFESEIESGRSIICQPYESRDSMNVCFVISGKLYHVNSKSYIMPGDYYTFKNLDETHCIRVEEKAKTLVIRKKRFFMEQVSIINKIAHHMDEIQKKDNYTDNHCNRTGNLGIQIAIAMNAHEKVIQNILYAGKIHDIGKIRISSDILNKPGKLSFEEYEIIKKHSQYGHDIITQSTQNDVFAKIILQHHERIDGTGYPNGLKDEEICLESKIIAVADCYDAMTSDRPYRRALTSDEAIRELKKDSGKLYDSRIINALIEIVAI